MKKEKRILTLLLAVVTLLGINSSVLKAKRKIKTNTEFVEKKDFEIPKNYLKSTGNSSIGSGSWYKYFCEVVLG